MCGKEAADRHETIRGDYRSILQAMTDEQKDAAAEKARKIIRKDRFLQLGLTVLRETRRLYSMGISAINRHMDEKGLKPEDGVEAILVTSATQEALKPFERDEVAASMQHIIMPFIASECSLEKKRENEEAVAQARADDLVRRTTSVKLPGPAEKECTLVKRGTVTVLLGDTAALQSYKENLMAFLEAERERESSGSVLHLKPELANKSINKKTNAKYIPVGGGDWLHCAQNISAAHRQLDKWLPQLQGRSLDLLVVDDLPQTYKGLIEAIPLPRLAGHAQKTLRKYGEEQGAAVLAFLDCEVPDPLQPEGDWSELLSFADVHIVEKAADGQLSIRNWQDKTTTTNIYLYLKD